MVDAPLQGREDEMRPYNRAGLSSHALKSFAAWGLVWGREQGF